MLHGGFPEPTYFHHESDAVAVVDGGGGVGYSLNEVGCGVAVGVAVVDVVDVGVEVGVGVAGGDVADADDHLHHETCDVAGCEDPLNGAGCGVGDADGDAVADAVGDDDGHYGVGWSKHCRRLPVLDRVGSWWC